MSLARFLTFPCIIVLLLLINSIDASFSIPQISVGFLSEIEKISSFARPLSFSPAQLMVAKNSPTNTILFVGDVLLARNVEFLMQTRGDTYPYQGIDFSTLAINPYVVGNFESSIPENHVPTAALNMTFSVNPVFLSALRQAGFTHFSLANNHSYDYGLAGYKYAVDRLTRQGFSTFGSPENTPEPAITYITVGNQTIALIGLYAVIAPPSDQALRVLFNKAAKKSDFQIVFIHWGEEYKTQNNKFQKDLATKLIADGADLIIGHHPHVVQNIDLIDGVPVFYSLGNYIFDQYFSNDTQSGLMVQVEFGDQPQVHIVPVSSLGTLSQPHFMNKAEHYLFLNDLAMRSNPQLKEGIRRGEILLNSWVATSSKIAMMD